MERNVKRLFDYQKFARNPRLEAMLSEAEGRYDRGLSDDDLELVSAAGLGVLVVHNPEESDQAAVPVINLPPEDRL